MEKPLLQIYQTLQKLAGLHRQLLDAVRVEREALIQVDLNEIRNVTLTKQSLIEEIHQIESQRIKQLSELALHWKKPFRELTLQNIIIEIQGSDPKAAEQFRSAFNMLTVLIQRVSEQNSSNKSLVEKSLEHVHQMKKNILGESAPQSVTYTSQGQRVNGNSAASRLISKEA